MYTYKVMIHPNNKQETKIRRTLNKCIECNNIVYDYLDNIIKTKQEFPNCYDVRKWFTIQKNIKDNEVIEKRKNMTNAETRSKHLDTLFYDVSNDALKQEIKNTYNSFVRFFKKIAKYPVKKEYSSYKKSYYVDPFKIEFSDRKVRLEKIANNQKTNRLVLNWVSLAEKSRIPTNITYYNPRVVLEGERFYIVVSVDDTFAPKKKIQMDENKTIGIDVNVSSIVTSDNTHYEAVTKKENYKKAKRQYLKSQKRLSKKYEVAKSLKKPLKESKNYQKQKKKRRKYKDRLLNLRDTHITEIINDLISLSPKAICVETLDVKEMKEKYNKDKSKKEIKNIASLIQENPFRKFLKTLEDRVIKRGIKLIYADKWYSSSKTCNMCGYKKSDLKLSERVFICPNCGLKIDRDYNAAINLKKYITI